MRDRPCVLRIAVLDTGRAAELVAAEDLDDDLVVSAVTLAAGGQLVHNRRFKQRARNAFLRYTSRMGGRATPYGLFAGTAAGRVGHRRSLELGPAAEHRVRVRIDAGALERVVARALDDLPPHTWPLRVNPTARRVGDGIRFARAGDESADVVSVRATPAIDAVLEVLGNRTLQGPELIARLQERSPASSAEALRAFVRRLAEGELLWRAADLLRPGAEPAALAVAVLDGAGAVEAADGLRTLLEDACGVHPLDPELPQALGKAWDRASSRIPVLGEVEEHARFHTDLELSARTAVVDDATVRDLEQALHRMEGMFPRFDALRDFRTAFTRRYEDAEVPLLEALDLETGVLRVPRRRVSMAAEEAGVRSPASRSPAETPVDVLRVYDTWLRTGRAVDISDFPSAGRTSARSVCALLLDDHEGRFRSLLTAGFRRSPAATMARFALGREDLAGRIRRWLAPPAEAPADGLPIHAELVHTPRTRDGNVLLRPTLHDDVIALDGGTGGTLGLDRLLIRVDGTAVRIRDAVSGRPVVVELNSAHYIRAAGVHPIYTFLGCLAGDGSAGWSWEGLSRLSHLPRVYCGSVIVAPEQWRLRQDDMREVLAHPAPERALRGLLAGVGERRWVGFGQHDQRVPVDLTSATSVRAGLAHFAGRGDAEVVEMPQVESPAVTGPTGRHVAEVVVPLQARHGQPPPDPHRLATFDASPRAMWAYAKYYTGCATADLVIGRAAGLARTLTAKGVISDWFFVRYDEDGHHVRVRMRAAVPQARTEVLVELDRLGTELRAAGLVTRVTTDDYVPETVRYGGPANLALAERLFTVDSDVVADLLAGAPDERARLFRVVADIAHWCGHLHGSAQDSQEFLRNCRRGLDLSFEPTGNRHGRFYRQHGSELDDHMAAAMHSAALDESFRALADSLRASLPPDFSEPVLALAMHMHCNRLFAVDGRRLEYLAYELAARKLREHGARAGRGNR